MINWLVLQEDTVSLICMYLITEYQKLIELQENIDKSIATVGNLKTSLLLIDISSRQKISKDRVDLNHTVNQHDLIDIFRIFNPKTIEYTFFSKTFTEVTTS